MSPSRQESSKRSVDLDADTWEQVRRAAVAEIPAAQFIGALLTATINRIDLKTLSKTAQNKVGIAIRQHQKSLIASSS